MKEALVAQHCGAKDGVLTAMPDEAVDWLTALISIGRVVAVRIRATGRREQALAVDRQELRQRDPRVVVTRKTDTVECGARFRICDMIQPPLIALGVSFAHVGAFCGKRLPKRRDLDRANPIPGFAVGKRERWCGEQGDSEQNYREQVPHDFRPFIKVCGINILKHDLYIVKFSVLIPLRQVLTFCIGCELSYFLMW